MERAGLIYSESHQVLICTEHEYALQPTGIETHLRRSHGLRSSTLQEALQEIKEKQLRLQAPQAVRLPPSNGPVIAGLSLLAGYHCLLPNCNQEAAALSQCRRTVEKHQARVHAVRKCKGQPHQSAQSASSAAADAATGSITAVSMQSFFQKPHYRPFVVQPAPPSPTDLSPPARRPGTPAGAVQQDLTALYNQSQEGWRARYTEVNPDLHKSQTPPWLRVTGISTHLEGLDKDLLWQLVQPTARSNSDNDKAQSLYTYLNLCVQASLSQVRDQLGAGSRLNCLTLHAARVLNSFEQDRTQSRPFKAVQEPVTLRRYSQLWSRLLFFCVSLQGETLHADLRRLRSLRSSEKEQSLLDQLVAKLDTLYAVQPDLYKLEAALHTQPKTGEVVEEERVADEKEREEEEGTLESDERVISRDLRLHARELGQLVDRLSVCLVRQEYAQNAFDATVVSYSAICALNHDGGWLGAHLYTPFLSGMIHCMQLWLLQHCIQKVSACDAGQLEELLMRECHRFLVNSRRTPIAVLSHWRLLSRTASNDTVTHPVTTLNHDCTVITHQDIQLRLEHWQAGLHQLLLSATEGLETELLLGLHEAPSYPVSILHDNVSDARPGRCFLDNPQNQLHAVSDWLFQQLQVNPGLRKRFFHHSTTAAGGETSPQWCSSAVTSYLHANQEFLRRLAVLIYMGSGLPPRRPELAEITWCNGETPRNIYLHYDLVAVITGYHKSQWRIGTRPTARFLPPAVGELLVRYLIYVPAFVRFLVNCMQQVTPPNTLFSEADSTWTADQVSTCFAYQTSLVLGQRITTRQWRHMAIAMDRRILLQRGCRLHRVPYRWGHKPLRAGEDSGSDWDLHSSGEDGAEEGVAAAVHHLQAAHTAKVGNQVYGNDISLEHGLTDTLLAAFRAVSSQWHGLTGLGSPAGSACSQKRPGSPWEREPDAAGGKRLAPGSSLLIRSQAWSWVNIEKGLQQLFGPQATARSEVQRSSLRLIARSRPETIIVMPTNSGKTVLFVVPSLLPRAEVTVVIVPLIALKHNLIRRCTQWGLSFACYQNTWTQSEQLHAVPSLLLVDVEAVCTPACVGFLQRLQAEGRLDRLVLDEAHLLLTAAHYRACLGLLAVLRRVHCPFVCLTATLPPSAEIELRQVLNFTTAETLRASSDRPNLQYLVERVPAAQGTVHGSLVDEAVRICTADLERWQATDRQSSARSICFVRSKQLGSTLAGRLNCFFYHGDLGLSARQEMIAAWSRGQHSPIMVATAAFGAGVDYPAVRRIIHIDAPSGLLDYAQETGRAGRDGLPAVCLTLLGAEWAVSWEKGFQSDFLTEDRMQMTRFLQSEPTQCLRQRLTAYLNGGVGVRCTTDDNDDLIGNEEVRLACSSCLFKPPPLKSPVASLRADSPVPEALPMPVQDPSPSCSFFAAFSTGRAGCVEEEEPDMQPLHQKPNSRKKQKDRLGALGITMSSASSEDDGEDSCCSSDTEGLTDKSAAEQSTHPSGAPAISQTLSAPSLSSQRNEHLQSDLQAVARSNMIKATSQLHADQLIYNGAEKLTQMTVMQTAETRGCFERSVIYWGEACIPCSFQRRCLIEGDHDHCLQQVHAASLAQLRSRIWFDRYTGCWRCGLPGFVCSRRGQAGCTQPHLLWQSCWAAVWMDRVDGPAMISQLGGPDLRGDDFEQSTYRYLTWLGKRERLFGLEASNAARVLHQWLDQLNALCVQTDSAAITMSSASSEDDGEDSCCSSDTERLTDKSAAEQSIHPSGTPAISQTLSVPSLSSQGNEHLQSDLQAVTRSNVNKATSQLHADQLIYNGGAEKRTRMTVMQTAETRGCFERSVIYWGEACIPCSFQRQCLVEGDHDHCLQRVHAASLAQLRSRVRFDRYTGCWRCGLPGFVCSRRGQAGCMQPHLLWQSCWTAIWMDRVDGPAVISQLGGPALRGDDFEQSTASYLTWLGKRELLFGLEASNAARVLHQWLDRLNALCVQTDLAATGR